MFGRAAIPNLVLLSDRILPLRAFRAFRQVRFVHFTLARCCESSDLVAVEE